MKILIVGMGLIGGSIAKALRMTTNHELTGIDREEAALLDAEAAGVIDRRATLADIQTADVIYICLYPNDAVSFVAANIEHFKAGCIVTDTCGVKTQICHKLLPMFANRTCNFVPGHPMAGKEKNGYASSDPSIFVGASYILTPPHQSPEAMTIQALAEQMGFTNLVYTTPEHHDALIAFTSQMPHAIACAYVLSPACEFHKGYSAGSYRDVSRVADINAALWSTLFLANREALIKEINGFIDHLTEIRDAVSDENREKLEACLSAAAAIKRRDIG